MSVDFDKEYNKFLRSEAKRDGVKFAYCDEYGVSVAYMPSINTPDCRMLRVAVSYCSEEDTFSKKVGRFQALAKLYAGEHVQLPLAKYKAEYGNAETKNLLLSIFSV